MTGPQAHLAPRPSGPAAPRPILAGVVLVVGVALALEGTAELRERAGGAANAAWANGSERAAPEWAYSAAIGHRGQSPQPHSDLADAGQAVEAARRALADAGRLPWYDAAADDLRRIEPRPPWTPWWERWDFNFRIPGFGQVASGLYWLVWCLIVVLLAAVVVVLVRFFLRRERGETEEEGPQDSDDHARRIEALPFPVRAAAIDLFAEARRCYAQGRFGEAVKYLYSHELVLLDRHQQIHLASGKTNRQYLRELKHGPLREILQQTMVAFEDSFFGNHRIERRRFETCWRQLGRFENLLEEAA